MDTQLIKAFEVGIGVAIFIAGLMNFMMMNQSMGNYLEEALVYEAYDYNYSPIQEVEPLTYEASKEDIYYVLMNTSGKRVWVDGLQIPTYDLYFHQQEMSGGKEIIRTYVASLEDVVYTVTYECDGYGEVDEIHYDH